MADLKISELSELAGGDLVAADELAIVDDSASETKKIGVANLIENGVTLISDDAIPGAKILFAAGDIVTADLADNVATTAKVADNAITAAKLADESTVDLVTELPASGAFTGQLALDTDDNKLYLWDGSSWVSPQAGVSDVDGSTTGIVNIVSTVSGDTVTISATLDDTTAAAQFLAGPVGAAGTVGYRTIDGGDLPLATTTSKGAVIVNGNGLQMNGDNIEIANTISASSVRHLVTYDANGLVTGGAAIAAGDLPIATTSSVGGVIVGDGLGVNASGVISVDNTVTAGEYTKVTVTERGLVSSGGTLDADDIPDHSAAKLTSGTIGTSLIATDAITAAKLADQSTTKFGGAAGSDNVTIFPAGDFKGQFFYDETTQDLYIYTGSAFVPVTVLSGNLVNAGAYNASTNQMSSVTSAGSSAGFSVGNALPAPAKTNLNHYVVVDTSGTGSGAAPAVALAPPDMLLSQGVGTEYSLIDVSNAIAGQTASNISLIATGDVIATDVQAAITELDTEKLPKAGGTMTGDLELNNADIVFEGSTADDYETTLTVTDPTADRTITLPNVTGTVVTTGDTGSVTSTMILDGTIADADISSSAEIAVSKLANGTARQLLQTDAAGTGVEFASNISIPGTLSVSGGVTLTSSVDCDSTINADKFAAQDGTASSPTFRFDPDTGIYSPADNELGITTGGTSRIVVDSSGNVGVGNTSPAQTIDITDSTPTARFAATGQTANRIFLESDRSTSNALLGRITGQWNDTDVASIFFRTGSDLTNKDDGEITFGTASAGTVNEQMRLDSQGRLLIGTTSQIQTAASDVLQLASTGATTLIFARNDSTIAANATLGVIEWYGNDDSGYQQCAEIRVQADGAHANDDKPTRMTFATTADGGNSPTSRMTIDSSGRLLVGTSSVPTINGGTFRFTLSGNDFSTAGIAAVRYQSNVSGASLVLAKARGSETSPSVLSSGDELGKILFVGHDGTDPETAGAQIQAVADGTPSANDMPTRLVFSTNAGSPDATPTERMRISQNGAFTSFTDGGFHGFKTKATSASSEFLRLQNNATSLTTGTTVARVRADGDLENANNRYTGLSDVKLKENIVDASSQWEDIKTLRVRNYNFKQETGFGTHTQLGVIAQEVETVSPGLVKEMPDLDNEGNDLGTTTKTVSYSVLYMKAVKALQEAMDRIETLEAKVAALEAGN